MLFRSSCTLCIIMQEHESKGNMKRRERFALATTSSRSRVPGPRQQTRRDLLPVIARRGILLDAAAHWTLQGLSIAGDMSFFVATCGAQSCFQLQKKQKGNTSSVGQPRRGEAPGCPAADARSPLRGARVVATRQHACIDPRMPLRNVKPDSVRGGLALLLLPFPAVAAAPWCRCRPAAACRCLPLPAASCR